ncbi:hypothetical protein ACFYTG_36900 [Streptomyces mirabilis]|uniref:hypothetical protein n=1 Tax=Streptomyces mirabilis TaxID=68239 RepID=UPI0036898BDB
MRGKPWHEYTPPERDDVNRLGALFETLQNELHFGLVVDQFVMVLNCAFQAEFDCHAAGIYPPAGHSYPRLED